MLSDLFFAILAVLTGRVPSFRLFFGLAAGHGGEPIHAAFAVDQSTAEATVRTEWVRTARHVARLYGGLEVSAIAQYGQVGYSGPLSGEPGVVVGGDFIPAFHGGHSPLAMVRWLRASRAVAELVRRRTGQEAVFGGYSLVRVIAVQGKVAPKFRTVEFIRKDQLA